ncbi:MAG: hypothetical protein ACI92Z_001906, partial [Paracoccaceae bacterium]
LKPLSNFHKYPRRRHRPHFSKGKWRNILFQRKMAEHIVTGRRSVPFISNADRSNTRHKKTAAPGRRVLPFFVTPGLREERPRCILCRPMRAGNFCDDIREEVNAAASFRVFREERDPDLGVLCVA